MCKRSVVKVGQWPLYTSLDNLVVPTKTKWCRTRLDDLQHLQDLVCIQNVPSIDQLKYSVEMALIANMKVDNKLKLWTFHLYLWHRIWRPLILNFTYCYHQNIIPNRREDTTPVIHYNIWKITRFGKPPCKYSEIRLRSRITEPWSSNCRNDQNQNYFQNIRKILNGIYRPTVLMTVDPTRTSHFYHLQRRLSSLHNE